MTWTAWLPCCRSYSKFSLACIHVLMIISWAPLLLEYCLFSLCPNIWRVSYSQAFPFLETIVCPVIKCICVALSVCVPHKTHIRETYYQGKMLSLGAKGIWIVRMMDFEFLWKTTQTESRSVPSTLLDAGEVTIYKLLCQPFYHFGKQILNLLVNLHFLVVELVRSKLVLL